MIHKFINWESLEFKKSNGKEKLRCPNCDEQRSDKTDKSLLINHNEKFGKCFYCESLTFKDETETNFTLPKQDWQNWTKLSDKLVKYFENRCINQMTLIDFKITEESHYQPKQKKEVNNIVFNYFEGEKLVNKKYRSAAKDFTQTTGAKSIFYNINATINEKEVYIVEGEIDVLSLYSIGVKNVISLPNGANDNDDYWHNSEKYLKDVEKFIIATDNDTKGIEVREKIAQRLGRYRCEYIEWVNKDANDDLKDGVLQKSYKIRKRFPVSGTFTSSDLYDGMINLYDNGLPKTISPTNSRFNALKQKFTTMRGHLIVGTGIPSHGKSEFTEDYVINLVNDYNMKASFFTPEHSPMELHQTRIAQKVIGKNFWKDYEDTPRITKDDLLRYKDWSDQKIYITMPERGEAPTWEWILLKFKEQMYSYGVDIFIIDAFNKVEMKAQNKLDEINNVLTKLTNFAQSHNVIVFLIAHPTKMKLNEMGVYAIPTLYDVSGSADFRNQTHDGFTIYRYFETETQEDYVVFVNQKVKYSFQGEIGAQVEFSYHKPTGRYYERGGDLPVYDMTKPNEIQVPTAEPKEAFNDIPF